MDAAWDRFAAVEVVVVAVAESAAGPWLSDVADEPPPQPPIANAVAAITPSNADRANLTPFHIA